ncbi:MAG: HD domain-containing phosphohydrolase [Oscillospiraceae bacterium]
MKTNEKRLFFTTIVVILALLAGFTVYNFISFYDNAVRNIQSVGENALAYETEQLNGYLNKGMDVLKVTSISVEYMMEEGKTARDIEKFLVEESQRYMSDIDKNFTGIYGWVLGEYIDGIGWMPPADYVAKERDWYIAAEKAHGDAVIVSPYLDAQTHTVMISVSRMLSDGDSVISLDIALNEIQAITSQMGLDDMGYGFIVVRDGMVVAHHNTDELGKNYYEDGEMGGLLNAIPDERSVFDYVIGGQECKIFTNTVMDDLRVVLVIESSKLFREIRGILIRNGVLCVIVFGVIVVFSSFMMKRLRETSQNEHKVREQLKQQNTDIIKTIVRIIDAMDRYTNGHSQRVANYSREIARRLGKSEEEQKDVYYAGLLHDVGKIRVPKEVINKPGKLNDEEFRQIKIHTITGFYILKEIYKEGAILHAAKFHHERFDGKGYPMGLSGENIPEVARIVGVADAYDAMASDRSYRKALPQQIVRHEIESGKGTQFDPKFADVMLKMIDEDKGYTMRQAETKSKTILVADEQVFTIRMVVDILSESTDYSIVGTQTEDEMHKLLGEMNVDLLVIDATMFEDIKSAISKIRQIRDLPIVLLISDKHALSLVELADIGVTDFVTKPISSYVFQEVIHGILD